MGILNGNWKGFLKGILIGILRVMGNFKCI